MAIHADRAARAIAGDVGDVRLRPVFCVLMFSSLRMGYDNECPGFTESNVADSINPADSLSSLPLLDTTGPSSEIAGQTGASVILRRTRAVSMSAVRSRRRLPMDVPRPISCHCPSTSASTANADTRCPSGRCSRRPITLKRTGSRNSSTASGVVSASSVAQYDSGSPSTRLRGEKRPSPPRIGPTTSVAARARLCAKICSTRRLNSMRLRASVGWIWPRRSGGRLIRNDAPRPTDLK